LLSWKRGGGWLLLPQPPLPPLPLLPLLQPGQSVPQGMLR
jgi:hypothetical protein